jgi:hypothetical protein
MAFNREEAVNLDSLSGQEGGLAPAACLSLDCFDKLVAS